MSKKTCDACGGRGTVAFSDYVVECAACKGTGTVGSGGSGGSGDGDKK